MARAKISPPATFVPIRAISDAEIDAVTAAGQLSLEPAERAALAARMVSYHDDLAIWNESATPRQVREKLTKLHKAAISFHEKLERLAHSESHAEATAYDRLVDRFMLVHQRSYGDIDDDDSMPPRHSKTQKARMAVTLLSAAAKEAAGGLVGKDGRAGNPYQAGFIRNLRQISIASTGKATVSNRTGEYRGPFLDMVITALEIIEGRSLTKKAAGRAIEEAARQRHPRNL